MTLYEALKAIKPGQAIRGTVEVMKGKDLEIARWMPGNDVPDHIGIPMPKFDTQVRLMSIDDSNKQNEKDVVWVLEQMLDMAKKKGADIGPSADGIRH